MGRLADDVANNELNVRFGGAAVIAPASYAVALSKTQPTNTGGNVTEPVGGGYARVLVARNATNFPAASARSISNGVQIVFPAPTAAWGLIEWFALYDAATAGVFQGWGRFANSTDVKAGGSAPVIPVGGMVIQHPGTP